MRFVFVYAYVARAFTRAFKKLEWQLFVLDLNAYLFFILSFSFVFLCKRSISMGFTTSKTSATYITTHNHLCHESHIQAHTLCNSYTYIDFCTYKKLVTAMGTVYQFKHVRSLKPWSAKYSQICQCQYERIHVLSNNTSSRIQKSIIIIALVGRAHALAHEREQWI